MDQTRPVLASVSFSRELYLARVHTEHTRSDPAAELNIVFLCRPDVPAAKPSRRECYLLMIVKVILPLGLGDVLKETDRAEGGKVYEVPEVIVGQSFWNEGEQLAL